MTTSDTGGYNFGSNNINSSGSGTAFAVPENQVILGVPNLSPDQRLRPGYANSTQCHRIQSAGTDDLRFHCENSD